MPKMYAPEGTDAVSVSGVELKVGEDGAVEVPEQAVDDLIAHGLTLAPRRRKKVSAAAAPDRNPAAEAARAKR